MPATETPKMTASVPTYDGTKDVEIIGLGNGSDSWGNRAKPGTCECIRGLGRTTYTLCGKPVVGIVVDRTGQGDYACRAHVAGALRRRTNGYVRDTVAILDVDGNQTHDWETTGTSRGYFIARDAV